MSFARSALRPLTLAVRTARAAPIRPAVVRRVVAAPAVRNFHATRAAWIKPNDPLPSVELMEKTPGNRVNLAEEAKTKNKILLIGVPAAFSGSCSATHVPSYLHHPKLKEFDMVAVVAVNDVFVMKAWGETLDPAGTLGIRFLADPTAAFTKALDLTFDGSALFGGDRSKRYAIIVENGKVKSVHVEPDNTGTNVSMADKVLGPAGGSAAQGVDRNA